MKQVVPYMLWNQAVDMTGVGKKATASTGAGALKRLRQDIGEGFDSAFLHRMITERADTLDELLESWLYERSRLGV